MQRCRFYHFDDVCAKSCCLRQILDEIQCHEIPLACSVKASWKEVTIAGAAQNSTWHRHPNSAISQDLSSFPASNSSCSRRVGLQPGPRICKHHGFCTDIFAQGNGLHSDLRTWTACPGSLLVNKMWNRMPSKHVYTKKRVTGLQPLWRRQPGRRSGSRLLSGPLPFGTWQSAATLLC